MKTKHYEVNEWLRYGNNMHPKPNLIYSSWNTFRKITGAIVLMMLAVSTYAQNKVVAYVPNWVDLNSYSNVIPYDKLTHINIAFENLYNDNGDLSFNPADNALINKAHANNVKVLVSIGGGAASGDVTLTNRYFTQISPARRVAFVAKISTYISSHNFDGIDVDLEGPSINGDYAGFIQELSRVLKPQGKLVTSALSQGYGGDKVPSSVFQYFDFINIMAYDGRGYWDPNTPGQHSSLDFAKSNTAYWLNRGLPKSKAILGVPFYGYGFGSAFKNRDYPYKDICAAYPGAEFVDQVGSTIWYNGIPTIKAKTNYAFDQQIGGIMIWSLDNDGPGAKSLLTAIDQVFDARSVVVPQGPYNNVRATLPGRIEAENYDVGGQNVAYNDLTDGNSGNAYRTDGVDIEATTGGGFNVGYTSDGEWLEYSVNITNTGLYTLNFRTASTSGGAIRMEVDGADVTGAIALPNTTAWQTWANTTKTNVSLSSGQHIIRLYVVTGGFNLNYVDATFQAPVQSPYNNTIVSLPGKIEAENYDLGGQGVAYNDATAANEGAAYRTDGVDVQVTTDAGAGHNIGWTADGEWLEYTVNVTTSRAYDISFRSAGTGSGAIRMEVDGIDVTGTVALPNTTGWQTWATTTKSNVALTAGQHIVRLFVITGGFNLNFVEVKVPAVVQSPYNNTIVSLPGKLEAENYDIGGQGIAYNDATPTNEGTAYRNDAVDVQTSTEGGHNIGWTQDGEWLEYTVNVTSSGSYDVGFRTASTSGGAIRMEIDGTDVTGTVALANTGGWQTWVTTNKTNVALTAGQHILRLFVVTGGFNLNYITVSPVSNGPGFLHASGKNIVNKHGNYVLKTLNLGNFMVQEGYMLNLGGQYQHVIKQKIADVVGTANRDQFYDNYYNNFITKADIDSIAKWGFNSVRLPMHYNLFTPLNQPDVYIEKGFTLVDQLLGWCKEKNLYLILDLHAAPGGQSSGDISDYVAGQPSLWESAANREKTVKLWRKFAERYVNEEYIGGYDLINETNWTLPNNNALLAQLMKDITAAIRQVDNNHLIFIEGNSYANDYNGLTPKWDNNMAYSFHKYWNDNVDGSLNFILSIRDAQNVPIWLGEFGENSNHWVAEAVSLMNKYNIGWAIWPYKKMGSISGISSHKQPNNWSALANYINGTGAKPTAAAGQAILNEWLESVKVQNCTVNYGYLYALLKQPGNNNTVPFENVTLPGRVVAAKYDEGKNGYAYRDNVFQTAQFGSGGGVYTQWNNGWHFRNDGVDLQFSTSENNTIVGYTESNEWLQYTVNVAVAGTYSVKARVAGNGGTMSLSSNGTTLLSNVAVAATGGWDTYQTFTLGNVNLNAGKNTLRLTINTAGYNISYLDFTTQSTAQLPYNGTPAMIPGTIQAEAYDLGGQGVAYNDLSAGNTGNAFRTDGVDIEATTDGGAGYHVGWTQAGEWLEYTVNVTTPGTYKLDARVATNAAGKFFHVEIDGQNISGAIAVPNTGAYQTFQTVSVNTSALTTGQKVMRIVMDADGFNLNSVTFSPASPTNNAPTVAITSPSGGSMFTEGGTITINANATDSDGAVTKVEFYNGTTLLGTDITSPYTLTHTAASGAYSLTAKATDDKGATTTSTTISVIVNPATNTCSGIAQYTENGGYAPGSKVQNAGSQYQCKPYPYSGWCNGASWAYAPGTGDYWNDAWILVGTCNAPKTASVEMASLAPNPTEGLVTISLADGSASSVQLVDMYGTEVLKADNVKSGDQLNVSGIPAGLYILKVKGATQTYTSTLVKN